MVSTYKVEFASAGERQLSAFDKTIQRQLIWRIEKPAHDPRLQGVEKLTGEECLYRVPSGDYRILYAIQDKALIVLVVKIADRKGVYRRLRKL